MTELQCHVSQWLGKKGKQNKTTKSPENPPLSRPEGTVVIYKSPVPTSKILFSRCEQRSQRLIWNH